jgi:DNA-binding MarR family transcriptional regulator
VKEPFDMGRPVPAAELAAILGILGAVRGDGAIALDLPAALRAPILAAFLTETETPSARLESVAVMRLGRAEIEASPDGIALGGPFLEGLMAAGLLTRDGLALLHFGLLSHCARPCDGRTALDLARAFQVPETGRTHTPAAPEARGLVEMRPDRRDGRSRTVHPTPAGRAFREEAIARLGPVIARLAGSADRDFPAGFLTDLRALFGASRDPWGALPAAGPADRVPPHGHRPPDAPRLPRPSAAGRPSRAAGAARGDPRRAGCAGVRGPPPHRGAGGER